MTDAMTTDECIESITHSCCEGGRRPFSERKHVGPWNHKGEPLYGHVPVDLVPCEAETDSLLAERAQDYGPPEINMTGIGLIWTAQLRNHYGMADLPVLSGQMVALMMAGLKLNRLAKSPDHQDSYDDLGGYAEIAKRLA